MERIEILTIKERDCISFLPLKDITHISCSGSLSTVYIVSRKPIRVSKLLKELEKELEDKGFVRINHNTIVNFNRLEHIKLEKDRLLVLDKEEFTISRRKMHKVREKIK